MSKTHQAYGDDQAASGLNAVLASSSQTPTASTTLTVMQEAGKLDGLVTGTFQGYTPDPLSGTIALAIGQTAALIPGQVPGAEPLVHVLADSPVRTPTVLGDIAFTTQANGPDNGSNWDIAVAATTQGFSGLTGPLTPALAGTTLGNELAPLIKISGLLLKGLGKNGGKPAGGTTHATPYLAADFGFGFSGTTTVFGHTTHTSGGGSLAVNGTAAGDIIRTAQDGATALSDGAKLLYDVQNGQILQAVTDGVATLAAGAAVGADVTTLIADAAHSVAPTLAAVANPALSLGVAINDSQSYGLGIGTPLNVGEQLQLTVTADKFGSYALGELAAQILPQVIADLSTGQTLSASSIYAQLAQGVSGLTQDIADNKSAQANGTPSLANKPDIQITAQLVTSESAAVLGGTTTTAQTFSLGFDANAQGLLDLGTAAQPLLVDLLVGILETPQGQEALGVGGAVLQSIDHATGNAYVNPNAGLHGNPDLAMSHYAHQPMM